MVQEEKPKEESPRIDFFGTDDVMHNDNIPELYPKGFDDEEP